MNAEIENHKETLGHTKHGEKKRKWPKKDTKNMQKREICKIKSRNSRRVASIRKGEMSNQQGEQVTEFTKRKRREAGIARNEQKARTTQEAQRKQ